MTSSLPIWRQPHLKIRYLLITKKSLPFKKGFRIRGQEGVKYPSSLLETKLPTKHGRLRGRRRIRNQLYHAELIIQYY